MNVRKPGTKVIIGTADDPIDGTIDQVVIDKQGVFYRIEWWAGREKKEAFFYEGQFKINLRGAHPQYLRIGFSKEQA